MKIGKVNRQCIGCDVFTSVLENIPTTPKQLFYIGTLPKNRPPVVAIVGSRKQTAYGQDVTYRIAYDLAKQGVVIISGLAFGVDAIAHQASLDAGGITLAVLAGGLHAVYPASHSNLAKSIVNQGGAILSEKTIGYEARRYDFLHRNRLVSGLADAVLITEATERSGTLSTVGHALEQNKDIFAVPGSINSLLSAGPNKLLQQGARVALNATDILEVIAPSLTHKVGKQAILPLGDTPLEQAIIDGLKTGPQSTEALYSLCKISASELSMTLTMLELKGSIRSLGGGMWGLA